MRRLAVFAGGFSLGAFLYCFPIRFLPWEGLPLAVAGASLGLGLLSLFLPWEWRRRGVALFAALALGLGWSWLYARQVQRPAKALAGETRMVSATLCGYASESDFGARVTVRLEGVPGKAVLYGGKELLELEPGQTVTGAVRLSDSACIRDEDVSSFISKGVFLLAYSRGELSVGEGTKGSPRWYPARLGQAMKERIRALFPGDAAGFLTAILTGDRGEVSEGAYIALTEAGLNHILAVSGMHCGFFMALVGFLVQSRKLQALLGIPLLAFYAALTGGSPSVVRACVMLSLPLLAILVRRESDGPTSLLTALFLILLVNPFAAASVSLQLSFAAMAGILWLTPKLYEPLAGKGKKGRRLLAASVSASLGAMVFTVPLVAYYFGNLVLIAPLSALLCLWAAGITFGFGMAAVLASFLIPPLGTLLALPAGLAVNYILLISRALSRVPYHALYYANPYLKFWVVYAYLLFAAAYLFKRASRRKYRTAALLAALTLAVTVRLGAARYQHALDALVLDVGQGQSVILSSGGAYALVDCGSGNSWKDPGSAAVWQLHSMGCRRLDWLVLTHYDKDHVSGVTGLLARMNVDTLLVPEAEDDAGLQDVVLAAAGEHGVEIRFITEQEGLDFGEGALTIFPPLGETGDNERGLTILASVGENDFLITGDMDSATEAKLLETYDLPDLEALVAGHHGSKYATSRALLEALTPETACISVGANSYGHPTDETLLRLARQGCCVYRTDLHGTIHLAWNLEEEPHG